MHVNTKKVATAGLLVAFSVVMMVLSSVIEMSSLFFIAAASFCVGIAVREWGPRWGGAFLCAGIMLNVFVVPDKWHCVTLAGMSVYIWMSEWVYRMCIRTSAPKYFSIKVWIGKYIVFNFMYVPVLFLAPHILFTGKINGLSAIILFLFGQVGLYIYDVAYRYFQGQVWRKLRKQLFKEI